MVMDLLKRTVDRLFGETTEQKLKRLQPLLEAVNDYADEVKQLSDSRLAAKTREFKERLEQGESLDDLLPEAFAVVREVAERTVGLRPYDVQVLGAVVLHQRRIAEMKTGEGKTLVATMPAYLNALAGKVHIVTVNDYLAKRDREWMGPVYEFLGLTVGLLQEGMSVEERRKAYRCDVIYGTNTQFGFDYLRDHLAISWDQRVQTGLDYAIVDEIDNILIDEARTPLIISGSTSQSAKLYKQFAKIAPRLRVEQDFEIDEKSRRVHLTEEGIKRAEELLGVENIFAPQNVELLHHLELALRARHLYHKDVDYIVKDGRVVIVDEFTGRLMEDRRYSEGLHQAIEAKEGMEIRRETQTLAQVTLQHYFKLYRGLAGMTGTAATEEEEFKEIYNLDVVVIPTHKPVVRVDMPDVLFKSEREKFHAIAEEIEKLHKQGRPVLIGTNSIEKSEYLSKLLKKRGLPHNVLNAKHHEREAEIIVDAGQKGAITVATNMAGRGVDIKLGEGVVEVGGLHIIGAQRHESRRIDDQLRGRSGRQGDPGSSQFYISLEDDLLRLFGDQKLVQWALKGMEEGQGIEHNMLTKAIRTAQQRVEAQNFSIRKRLLEYDAVMARQREAIYALRDQFLLGRDDEEQAEADFEEYMAGLIESHTEALLERYCPDPSRPHHWDLEGLQRELAGFQNAPFTGTLEEGIKLLELEEIVRRVLEANYQAQKERLGGHFHQAARFMILSIIDEHWRQHLYELDDLREGIGWRAFHGRDPLVEFTRESFRLFQEMMGRIEEQIVGYLLKPVLSLEREAVGASARSTGVGLGQLSYQHEGVDALSAAAGGGTATATQSAPSKPKPRRVEKVGRNDPCPCGSGKKYKHCCGA
jgi:preprotein translocase subunit SecA